MSEFFPSRCCFFAVLLFLWPGNAPAQEPVVPPLPPLGPATSPPPDPASLPPPPSLEWAPLGPKDSDDRPDPPREVVVPPPQPEVSLAPPPPPLTEIPLPAGPGPEEMELVQPDIEVWREESEFPQIPPRQSNRLEQAYVTGTEPVALRVQFSPLAAGKRVIVKAGEGITLNPPVTVMTISSSGECIVSAQLGDGLFQSHIIFYCEGVKTVLPVVRGSQALVEAKEEESRP